MKAVAFTQGQTAFAAADGTSAPGRLMGISITTQGSTTGASLAIYDNATAASGTVVFTCNGSGTAAFTVPVFVSFAPLGIPFSNGLWVVSTASTGAAGTLVISTNVVNDGRPGV